MGQARPLGRGPLRLPVLQARLAGRRALHAVHLRHVSGQRGHAPRQVVGELHVGADTPRIEGRRARMGMVCLRLSERAVSWHGRIGGRGGNTPRVRAGGQPVPERSCEQPEAARGIRIEDAVHGGGQARKVRIPRQR